jgi:hypothetical protein
MDIIDAEKKAKEHLAKAISLKIVENPHGISLYGFDPEKHYLFSFTIDGPTCIGSDNYMAVCKETGKVKFMGSSGE